MKIQLFVVGEGYENTYFVIDEQTNDAILIDPGAEPEKLDDFIQNSKINLKYIVLTHAHHDHIGACNYIKEKYNIPLYAGEGEQLLLENSEHNLSIFLEKEIEIKDFNLLKDAQILKFGNLELKVIKTPGHTPGGICIYFENEGILFSGDTLFCGTIGRTDFTYGDTKKLIQSIQTLKKLPDQTRVFPGHGEDTTIKDEKMFNPYLSERQIL